MSRQSSPASQPPPPRDEQSRGVVSMSPSPAEPPEPVMSPAEPPEPVTLPVVPPVPPVVPPALTLWSLEVVALDTLSFALVEPPALVASVLLVPPSGPAEGSPFFSDLPQARTANPTSSAPNRSRTRRE